MSLQKSAAPGIIPAYAGNTSVESVTSSQPRDHPRLRGEHGFWNSTIGGKGGSSPPTRGTHRRPVWGRDQHGIIPAYAGNTGQKMEDKNE